MLSLPIFGIPLFLFAPGTPEELHQEVQRLEGRLQHLRAGEARVAAVAVDAAADPDGRMLALLLKWRQQRLRAIESEVDRLKDWVQFHEAFDAGPAGLSAGLAVATN
jgi:hypothetical protein